jgi:hypothetical protein
MTFDCLKCGACCGEQLIALMPKDKCVPVINLYVELRKRAGL